MFQPQAIDHDVSDEFNLVLEFMADIFN